MMLIRLKGLEKVFPDYPDRILVVHENIAHIQIPSEKGLLIFRKTDSYFISEDNGMVIDFELEAKETPTHGQD